MIDWVTIFSLVVGVGVMLIGIMIGHDRAMSHKESKKHMVNALAKLLNMVQKMDMVKPEHFIKHCDLCAKSLRDTRYTFASYLHVYNNDMHNIQYLIDYQNIREDDDSDLMTSPEITRFVRIVYAELKHVTERLQDDANRPADKVDKMCMALSSFRLCVSSALVRLGVRALMFVRRR